MSIATTRTPLPLDIPVHNHPFAEGIIFAALFGKAEAEFVAVALVRTLGRDVRNTWRSVTLEEVWPELVAIPAVQAGIIDPVVGLARLEELGHVDVDREAKTIMVRDSFVAALGARFPA